MEKFSRFRDPATGIQVFLTPVPPASASSTAAQVLAPVAYVLGAVRFLLVLLLVALYALLNALIGGINRSVGSVLNAIFGRTILFCVGFAWISVEQVSLRNRGRAAATCANKQPFNPQRGDIIVANWASWVEVVWLAIKFNPTFLLPVVSPGPHATSAGASEASPARASPARRKNAASEIRSASPATGNPALAGLDAHKPRLQGFRRVSLLQMVTACGQTPLVRQDPKDASIEAKDLETLAKTAQGPLVVFPELVTSNNRGLLRMASVFPTAWRSLYRATGLLRIGAGQPNLFFLAIKHEPPTPTSASSTLSVPSSSLNPLRHLWALCSSLALSRNLTIRMLEPSESITSPSYSPDPAATTTSAQEDALADACGNIISQLSRLRRTGLGWEDKEAFLNMYRARR